MRPKKIGVVVCALLLTITQGEINTPLAWGESHAAPFSAVTKISKTSETSGPITSSQVVSLLLQYNQEIVSLGWKVKSREAAALQATLRPNPEFGVEMENFAGSGAMNALDSVETTISISQLIELGGKRSMRHQAGTLDVNMAGFEAQATRLDLIADAQLAFVEVLAAQERVRVAGEQLKVAEEIAGVVQARVQAGKVSPIESTKAKIALSASRITLNNAKRKLVTSRNGLALFWGSKEPLFSNAVGNVMDVAAAPSIELLINQLDNHPLIKEATLAVEKGQLKVRLARTDSIPDLTVSGGYRNFADSKDHAFVAGISIPIPYFNRNQGSIAEAVADLAKVKSELIALRTRMITELNQMYHDLLAAELETEVLGREVLPSARSTFEAVQEGYRQGKFSYLEVLDAQKTLFDVSLSRIEASNSYHASMIQLHRLAGLELEL